MWVSIAGVDYFSGDTWGDVKAHTWVTLFDNYTWAMVLDPHDNKLLASPQPAVRDLVESRTSAEFSIIDFSHAYSFYKGQYVEIKDHDLDIIFEGFIEEVTQERMSPDGVIIHNVSCTDNHYLADKILLAKGFDGATYPTIADIVTYIVENVLDGEGVLAGTIVDPTEVDQISFDYVPCSEALDQLATYGNCTWYIDFDKTLHFYERSSVAADWSITEVGGVMSDVLWDSFRYTSSAPEYRNYQYVRGGFGKTAIQTEYFPGDGTTRNFPIAYKPAEEPDVYVSTDKGVNYTLKTVGIKGVETGKDWYWSANDQIIAQDFGGTVLAADSGATGGRLKVVYYGLYPIITTAVDFTQVLDRKSVEGGGSGYVQALIDDSLITTEDAGMAKADALLSHYAQVGNKIEYITTRKGLEVGVLQHIESTIHDIDDDFLITGLEKVAVFLDSSDPDNHITHYRVTAVSGPVEDYWSKVFLKFSQTKTPLVSSSATNVVLIPLAYTHDWLVGDTPNIWTCALPDGTYTPSSPSFPGFDVDHGPTYLSLWNSGVELFRKYLTSQTYVADTSFTTIWYLNPGEANFAWDEIRIFGGDAATSTLGTGTELYTIGSSAYTKNSLEALQITVIDYHW